MDCANLLVFVRGIAIGVALCLGVAAIALGARAWQLTRPKDK